MPKIFRMFLVVVGALILTVGVVLAASTVIDNGDTAGNWTSSDATNTVVSQETTIKQEGTGSVKVQTTAEASTTIDLMEYSSDGTAQAGYVSNNTGLDDSYTKALLHMNGADASTTFTDESGKTWTVAGNAQIDTAILKFGSAAGLFDGTGDYADTPDHADFDPASGDFTIDVWFNRAGGDGANRYICGQADSGGSGGTTSWGLSLNSSNVVRAVVRDATTWINVVGTTAFTATGWHHVALVRTGDVLRLFIDGVQEGGDVAFTGAVNNSANKVTIGRLGELASQAWNGSLDEWRFSKGIARWTTNFTPPTLPYESLRAYSESTIKTQGTYALKSTANQTTSLNKTLTRTIDSPVDLSNYASASFSIRASRTGSNIKVGLHDSGGTTTEVTPNVTQADTYQTATFDLSGVTNANKDAIDQIIITIVNADATNTFYLDNMVAAYGSLNDTVTLTKSSTDLSSYTTLLYWVRSTVAGSFARLQFGESESTEQTDAFTINTPDTWEQKTWDISGITGTARDAVTKLALQFTSDTSGSGGLSRLYPDKSVTSHPLA